MKLSLLACGRDPARTFARDPKMAPKHIPMKKRGPRPKSPVPLCVYCGCLVVGYLPKWEGDMLCCSLECARRARGLA